MKPKKTVIAKTKSTRVEYGFAPTADEPKTVRVREAQRRLPEKKPLFGRRKRPPPENDPEKFLKAITPEGG